jgi:hypothetical protein
MTGVEDRALLARILGPTHPAAEAEIGCDECFDRLDVYVDAEVDGADPDAVVPGMRPHLVGCGACREEYESLLALRRGEAAGDRTA